MKFQEIPGVSRDNCSIFHEIQRASNDPHDWATKKNLDFKLFKTVFLAENKGQIFYKFSFHIYNVNPLRSVSGYYSLCYGIYVILLLNLQIL